MTDTQERGAGLEFDCGALGPDGRRCGRPVTAAEPQHRGPHRRAGVEWARDWAPAPACMTEAAVAALARIDAQVAAAVVAAPAAPAIGRSWIARKAGTCAATGAAYEAGAALVIFGAAPALVPVLAVHAAEYLAARAAAADAWAGISAPVAPVVTAAAPALSAPLAARVAALPYSRPRNGAALAPEAAQAARLARQAARGAVTVTNAERLAALQAAGPALGASGAASGYGYKVAKATVEAPQGGVLAEGALLALVASQGGCDGSLFGWQGRGRGSKTRAALVGALQAAGMPATWAPAAPNAKAILGQAVTAGKGGWHTAAVTKGGAKTAWTARHVLYPRVDHTVALGDSVGDAGIEATLDSDGALVLQVAANSDAILIADRIRGEFDARCAGAIYPAGEVTAWLQGLLRDRMGALYAEPQLWVPNKNVGAVTKLFAALDWGGAMPGGRQVITDASLRRDWAAGLVAEVADLAKGWAEHVAECKAATPQALPSKTRAATIAKKLAGDIGGRVRASAEQLGDLAVSAVRAAVKALAAEVASHLTDAGTRASLLEIDVAPLTVDATSDRVAPCQRDPQ